jgi:hypothetical protein
VQVNILERTWVKCTLFGGGLYRVVGVEGELHIEGGQVKAVSCRLTSPPRPPLPRSE